MQAKQKELQIQQAPVSTDQPTSSKPEEQPAMPGLTACFVTYSDFGANGRACKQAEALLEAGYSVDVIIPRSRTDINAWKLPEGINLHFMPIYKQRSKRRVMYILRYVGFFFLAFFALTKMYFKRHYRYIQASTLPEFLVFTALIPRLLGARVVLDVCDLSSDLYESKFRKAKTTPLARLIRLIEKSCLVFASDLISVHEPYRKKLLERGVKDQKLTILLNVADESVFKWQQPETDPAPGEPFRLVYPGTIARRNGVDIMVRALAQVKKTAPELKVVLDVYGDGDDFGEVEKLVKELNVSDTVRLHKGFVPVSSLPKLLAGAQAGLVANRYDGFMEYTLPTKLMEYVALGLPGIVARTTAIEDYFKPEQVGFFEPENHEDLARQIVELARQPHKARQMAHQAYKFYDEHNWQNTRQRYVALARRQSRLYLRLKRVLDLALSIPALILLSPVMAAVAVAVKLTSPGPALFQQERLGKDKKPFTIYKFRTMKVNNANDAIHKQHVQNLMKQSGGEWLPIAKDSRLTPIGSFMRKTGLDELPQLFNVVTGDMSLVGPRPPLAYEVAMYEPWQLERLDVLPGVSGLWQVSGRGSVSFDEMVKQDIEYARRANLLLDIWIIVATIPSRLMASRKYGR